MDQFGSLIHMLTQQDEHLAEMRRVVQLGKQLLPLKIRRITSANAALYSSARISRSRPNPRIDVDPDLQMLMQDVDMALNKHLKREQQQLEIIPREEKEEEEEKEKEADFEDDGYEPQSNLHRKSPAALFGSQRVGAVVIPQEMQDIIQRLFSGNCSCSTNHKYELYILSQMSTRRSYTVTLNGCSKRINPAPMNGIISMKEDIKLTYKVLDMPSVMGLLSFQLHYLRTIR